MRGRRALLLVGCAIVLAGVACAAPPPRLPEAKAGPFRVVVDRVTSNNSLSVLFGPGAPRDAAGGVEARFSVQLQLAVHAASKEAAAGLATFQVNGVTLELGGRVLYLPHYGGVLDNPNDPSLVRAYLYIPSMPVPARELGTLEGQIVAYERSTPVDFDIPMANGPLPRTIEKDGIKATLREVIMEGGTVQVALWLEASAAGAILSPSGEGAYGVTLHTAGDRIATTSGGTFQNPRPNQAEYRLSFQNLRSAPERLHVRILHRGGERFVYPFRIERIPIPDRKP